MILKSLELKNFRHYINEKIIFSTDMDKSFTIIQGTTGAGKTTILNAITWCLYGEELHRRTKKRGLTLYNTTLNDKITPKEKFNVLVEMDFVDSEGNEIIIRREKSFQKQDDGKISETIDEPEVFKILKQEGGRDYKSVDNPVSYIERIAPKDIEEYFFFDGERLDDYFDENAGTKTKDAVFQIAQIDLFTSLLNNLNKRKDKFSREYSSIHGDSGKFESKIRKVEAQIAEKNNLLEQTQNDLEIAENNMDRIQEDLKLKGSEEVRSLQNDRDRYNGEIRGLDKTIKELKMKRTNFILEMCPKIFAYPAILKTKELTQDAKKEGYLPAKYKELFIGDLLNAKKCICGMDLTENEECRKTLEKVQESTSPITNIEEDINEENVHLNGVLKEIKHFKEYQNSLVVNLHDNTKKREKKDELLNEISTKLENIGEDKVKEMELNLKENQKARDDAIQRIALLKDKINDLNADKVHNENERDKAERDSDIKVELGIILDFCRLSINRAEDIQKYLIDKIREDVKLKTEQQFDEIILRGETYKGIIINENYDVKVKHVSGDDAAPDLSSGEGQILALSFMAALNSVSGFNLPTIIDTPLGRLDEEPTGNIADNFPNYLKGKQVVLLVTSKEYSESFRKKIYSRVGEEYKINRVQTDSGSYAKVSSYE